MWGPAPGGFEFCDAYWQYDIRFFTSPSSSSGSFGVQVGRIPGYGRGVHFFTEYPHTLITNAFYPGVKKGRVVTISPIVDTQGMLYLKAEWGARSVIVASGLLVSPTGVVRLAAVLTHVGDHGKQFPQPFVGTAVPSVIVEPQGWPGGSSSRNTRGPVPMDGWEGVARIVWYTTDLVCVPEEAGNLDSPPVCYDRVE